MANETTKQAPYDRILAVDLTKLTPDQMDALTKESVRRCVPLSDLLGSLVDDSSRRILNREAAL